MTFEGMSLKELQAVAKEKGLKKISGYKKQELIDALNSFKPEETGETSKEKKISEEKVPEETVAEEKSRVMTGPVNDSNGGKAKGILEVLSDGFGFIRSDNFMPGEDDVYVPNALIKKFNLRTGDVVEGTKKRNRLEDKFMALIFVSGVNGKDPIESMKRKRFEKLTPIYPEERIYLENAGAG